MQDERARELARRQAKAAGNKLIEAVSAAAKTGTDISSDVRRIGADVEALEQKAMGG